MDIRGMAHLPSVYVACEAYALRQQLERTDMIRRDGDLLFIFRVSGGVAAFRMVAVPSIEVVTAIALANGSANERLARPIGGLFELLAPIEIRAVRKMSSRERSQ
jgi:hypothetical protein